MPSTNIPPSVPSKRLALPLTATGTTMVINNIEDHLGTDLTSNDVPALLYATLYNDAKTKFEIIEIDGTTIALGATTGLTINKRGLSFDGGTTAAAETAQDWSAGDTVVQLGTNPSQYYMFLAGDQTITGAKTFSGAVTFSSGVTVSSSLEVTGAITGSSSLAITGNAQFSTGGTFANTLVMSSGATVAEGLDVTSSFTANDAALTSGLTATTGNFSSGIQVLGASTFSSAVGITGALTGSTSINISLSNNSAKGFNAVNLSTGASAFSALYLGNSAGATDVVLANTGTGGLTYGGAQSGLVGTNSNAPFSIITNATERMRVSTGGGFHMLNVTSSPTAIADGAAIYAQDTSTGASTLGIVSEFTPEVITTSTATYKHKVRVNGTEYYMMLSSV